MKNLTWIIYALIIFWIDVSHAKISAPPEGIYFESYPFFYGGFRHSYLVINTGKKYYLYEAYNENIFHEKGFVREILTLAGPLKTGGYSFESKEELEDYYKSQVSEKYKEHMSDGDHSRVQISSVADDSIISEMNEISKIYEDKMKIYEFANRNCHSFTATAIEKLGFDPIDILGRTADQIGNYDITRGFPGYYPYDLTLPLGLSFSPLDNILYSNPLLITYKYRRSDPVILTFENIDFEFIDPDIFNIEFDFNGDGNLSKTSWVHGYHAFLFHDLNKNGYVDNGTELFGDQKIKSNGLKAFDGLDSLNDIDENMDGFLNIFDESYKDLYLWFDINYDGESQYNEIFPLYEYGVDSINLINANSNKEIERFGQVNSKSTFVYNDAEYIWRAVDFNIKPSLERSNNEFRKYYNTFISNEVSSLGDAINNNISIKNKILDFENSNDIYLRLKLAEDILILWSYTTEFINLEERLMFENIQIDMKDENGDLNIYGKISLFEGFYGNELISIQDIGRAINEESLDLINNKYEDLIFSLYFELIKEDYLLDYYKALNLSFDKESGLKISELNFKNFIEERISNDYINTIINLTEFVLFYHSEIKTIPFDIVNYLQYLISDYEGDSSYLEDQLSAYGISLFYGQNHISLNNKNSLIYIPEDSTLNNSILMLSSGKIYGAEKNEIIFGYNNEDEILGKDGKDIIYGRYGNDTLDGGYHEDYLDGGAGDDILGNSEEDRLGISANYKESFYFGNTYVGGTGNDELYGTIYADLYIYNLGDGYDNIYEDSYPTIHENRQDSLEFGEGILPEHITYESSGDDIIYWINKGQVNEGSITLVGGMYGSATHGGKKIHFTKFKDGTTLTFQEVMALVLDKSGTSDDDTLIGYAKFQNTLRGLSGDDFLQGNDIEDSLFGGDGSDTLDGSYRSDYLDGGAGDDILGNSEEDRLGISANYKESFYFGNTYVGGTGNDELYGTIYADLYIYNLGDGYDNIYEDSYSTTYENRQDSLEFGEGILPEHITYESSGDDIIYWINKGQVNEGSITLVGGMYGSATHGGKKIHFTKFKDGTTLTFQEVMALVLDKSGTSDDDTLIGYAKFQNTLRGLSGDDFLQGNDIEDSLFGGDGNDTLDGSYRSDYLDGGAGNDILGNSEEDRLGIASSYNTSFYFGNTYVGGTGNDELYGTIYADLYIYNLGDGYDNIYEDSYSTTYENRQDSLEFGEGILPEHITYESSGDDIIYWINKGQVNEGSITLVGGMYGSATHGGKKIHFTKFKDGTVLEFTEILSML